MAQHQYDAVNDDSVENIVANQSSGSSISTSAVRLTIDDSNCHTKEEAVNLIEKIKQAVIKGVWPPTP